MWLGPLVTYSGGISLLAALQIEHPKQFLLEKLKLQGGQGFTQTYKDTAKGTTAGSFALLKFDYQFFPI